MSKNILLTGIIENDVVNRNLYRKATQTALDNAFDIFEEAAMLYDHNKFPRASALCMLSLEELTKSFVYRCISVNLLEEKGIRSVLLDHSEKLISAGHFMTFTILVLEHFDKIQKAIEHDKKFKDHKDHQFLDTLHEWGMESAKEAVDTLHNAQDMKLDSIYVDILDGKIIDPKEVIKKDKCHKTISNTGKVLGLMKPLLESSDEQFTEDANKFLWSTIKGIKREIEIRMKKKQKRK